MPAKNTSTFIRRSLVLTSALTMFATSSPQAELTVASLNADILSEFEYPADYMRREPTLHRAISKTFYTGASVKLANGELFKKKAELSNYYHVQLTNEELEAEVSHNDNQLEKSPLSTSKKGLLNLKPVGY